MLTIIASWFFGILLLVGIFQSCVARPEFVSAHPFNVAWIFFSAFLAGSWIGINRESVGATRIARGLGFGIAGCLLAFSLQGFVNGDVLRRFTGSEPGLGGYFLLAAGAAICQVFGKWVALLVVLQGAHRRSAPEIIALGLGVGLGFAAAEIVVIGQGMIARSVVLDPPAFLSLMERFSAGGFHVYSGALIAISVATRRLGWVVAVFALHSVADWFAGAQGHAMHQSQILLELFFLVLTGISWWLYDRARRTLRDPGRSAESIRSEG